MTHEQSQAIEELLKTWFAWANNYRPHLGAPRVSVYSRGFESNDVYIDAEDADARIDRDRAEQVDACIDGLIGEQRIAVGIHAGNLSVGNAVFRSIRYTKEQLHSNYQAAKALLLPQFLERGLVQKKIF